MSCTRVYDFISGAPPAPAAPPCAGRRAAATLRPDILRANATAADLFLRHQRALLRRRGRRPAAAGGGG